jgi:hypothetical protein
MDTLDYYEWCKTILPDLIAEGKLEAFDEDEGEPDREWLMEEITNLILDEGDVVYGLYWDSGGPGAGAGAENIFRFRGLYFSRSEVNGVSGPFPSLDDVLAEFAGEFLGITEATVEISCDELSAADVASRLVSFLEEAEHVVKINGEKWRVTKDGQFEPITH